ncbi:MAG: PhoU domain-containing protein [Thermoplasmata archaeon]
MEYRKLQKIGGSSYSITLPKEWVELKGLKEGSTILIKFTENKDLIISTEEKEKRIVKSYIIKIEESMDSELLLRKIISVYLAGVEKIIISSEEFINENIRSAIEFAKKLLIGIEIIEETGETIILQDLSKIDELPMNKMLLRLFYMAEEMIKDTKRSVLNLDKKLAKEIIERDTQIDRIYLFISKQFYQFLESSENISKLNIKMSRAFNIRTIAKYLERICDHLEKIAYTIVKENNIDLENKIIEKFSEWFDEIIKIFENSIKSFNLGDEKLANYTINSVNKLSFEIDNVIKDLEIKQSYIIFRLGEDLTRIAKYLSDICETSINDLIMSKENLFTEE